MFVCSITEINRLLKEINRLLKEINRLLSKGMSNKGLLKSYYWEKKTYSNLRLSEFKKFVSKILLNFQTFCCNLKIRGLGARLWVAFLFF